MDTLSFHKARPLQSNVDLSEARLQHVANQYESMKDMLTTWDGGVMAHPETEALWFYVQQHAMGLAERSLDSDEPMGGYAEFVTAYHKDIPRKAMRMFYYLLLICTRESRHAGGTMGLGKLYKKHPSIEKYHRTYVRDQAHETAINSMFTHAPDVSLGEYTEFLVHAFTYCSFSGWYGGKKWAAVARPLRDFVHGKISAEILMDTAFTLEHNNGNIFNKGMLYHSPSSGLLRKILDVQRSGQIPQLIAHHYDSFKSIMNPQMTKYVTAFSRLESGFAGPVDWKQVKGITGTAKYKSEIKLQEASDGFMDKLKAMKEKVKDNAVKFKATAAKAALLKGSIEIMPNIFVVKGKRSQQ